MTKYDVYCRLRDARHLSDSQVSVGSGVNRSTFSDWKNGRCEPKEKKLRKIADFFNVSVSVFYPMDTEQPVYHFDKHTADLAQEITENEDLRLLVDASKKISARELTALRKLVEEMADGTDQS